MDEGDGPPNSLYGACGGVLSNNKGINRQRGGLSAAALTEKDKEDIKTAAAIGVDYVAVSFPRDASDMDEARRLSVIPDLKPV